MGIAIALILIAIIALVIWLVITRGLQLKQLLEDGIDTEGKVLRQFKHNPKTGSLSTDHFLRYSYRDRNGIEHEYKSRVNRDFWAAHPEGSTIAITYSKSKAEISAPRFLVDAARETMAKRKP